MEESEVKRADDDSGAGNNSKNNSGVVDDGLLGGPNDFLEFDPQVIEPLNDFVGFFFGLLFLLILLFSV